LAGIADLESALKKLDRLTQEEARMALAEVLRVTHSVRNEFKVVDGKVEGVGEKVENVGVKVEDIDAKVEDLGDELKDVDDKVEDVIDKMQCVDEKVQVVLNGAQCVFTRSPIVSNFYSLRWKARKSSGGGSKIDHSRGSDQHRQSKVFVTFKPHCCPSHA
jgi:predicted nuclease with TOPRIM domain